MSNEVINTPSLGRFNPAIRDIMDKISPNDYIRLEAHFLGENYKKTKELIDRMGELHESIKNNYA